MAGNQIKFDVGFNVSKTDLKDLISSLQNVQKEINQASTKGTLTDELKKAGSAAKELESILKQSWNENLNQLNLNKFNQSIKNSYGSISKLRQELQGSGQVGVEAFNKIASTVLNTNVQLRQTNKLLDNFATTFKNTIRYGISSSIFNNISNSIQKAFSYSKQLDTSLNDIRIVTDKSADSMESFAKQANQASKELGAATLDYTNASLIYYQQGLSDEEVAARTETTIKAANVTGQTGEEVSEQLTAVWNGYKVTAEETEAYVDKLAAVAATTAADLEELSVGMSKVAAAANSMGVDFDDLNAQIATIVSVTRQAPESVGTALKTIYARLGDLKVSGVDEFGVSLGEVSGQMQKMGIQILDQEDNLRDMSSVIAEVAQKWMGWTEAQRQAAAVAMAGKRQYNNLIALFDNWDMYTGALNTSVQAVGTLQQQQDIYMESTSAKLKELRTETERTYDILFDTDTANNFIDVFSGVLSQFNDFIEGLGGGTNVLINFGAIIANVFNKQLGQGINQGINNLQAYIDQIRMAKNQAEMIAEVSKQDVQNNYTERGISYNETSEAVKTEARMRAEILKVSQSITQEEFQQLAARQQQAGNLEREIEELYKYKDVFKKQFDDADIAEEKLEEWYEKQLANINALKEEYEQIKTITEEINDSEKDLTYQEGIDQTKQQLESLYNNEILSEERRYQLKLLLNELNNNNLLDEEKAELIEENKNLILASQKTILKEEQQLYEQIYAAGEKRIQVEAGVDEKLKNQSEELQRQNKAQIESAQRAMKISSIITKGSGIVQGISSVVGALNAGLSETATGADKANAIFSGTSGVISSIANFLFPGSGILVQGVLSIGKGVLELTGLWDDFEDSLKSTEERLEEINKKVQEFATSSKEYESSVRQLEEIADEYEKLSVKAGVYDSTIDDLTSTERERYNELKDIILKYNQEALLGYNDRGEAILAENEGIRETIELLREKYELERTEFYTGENFESTTETFNKKYEEAQKEYQGTQSEIDIAPERKEQAVQNLLNNLNQTAQFAGEIPEEVNKIDEILAQGAEKTIENKEKLYDYINELEKNNNFKLYIEDLEGYKEIIEKISENLEETAKVAEEKFKKDSKINTSWVLGAVKYNPKYNSNYNELVNLAEENGIEDIDSYIINYANGIQLGVDAFNYDEIYDKVAEFYNNLYSILQTNPKLIQSGEQIAEELSQQEFISYQDRINKTIAAINQYIEENKDTFNQLDEQTKKTILENIFGISAADFDGDFVSSISLKASQKITELQEHIQELWGKNIDREALTGLLGADISDSDLNYLIESLDETKAKTLEWDEALKSVQKDLVLMAEQNKVGLFLSDVNTALSAMTKNGKLTKAELQGMSESLEALEQEYPSLAAIRDRESTAYYNKLLEIREALEEQQQLLAQQKENKLIDEAVIVIESNGGEEEIQEKLLDICNADYEVLVEVKSDIQDDFDTAVNAMDQISEMASKIGDDFIVAAEDIEELNNVFPGILANMQLVGDGTVKLNEEIVKGAMEAAEAEVAADTDATISKLQNQADELLAKRDAARHIAEIAEGLVNTEEVTDEAKGQLDKALNQLKTDNSETTSDNQQQDQTDVAENAAEAATSMANSFEGAYRNMAQNAAAWANVAHQALLSATNENVEPPSIGEFSGASYQSTSSVQKIQSNKSDLSNFEDYNDVGDWKEVADYYNNLADSYDEAYNSVIGKIGELAARGQGAKKTLDNISKGLGSDGKKSKSGGGGKDKKDKDEKKYNDEFDRYWEIKKAIDAVDFALKRLAKDQKNLYGTQLIDSLKIQNDLLEQQKAHYDALWEAQEQEAAELRAQLGTMGLVFDASGAITNYAAATTQALAEYNAAIQQYNTGLIDETALGVYEKAYENFKKLLERYDTLYYKEIQDTIDKIDNIRREQLANNLKAWEVKVELKLNLKELKRGWIDFIKEINEDFQKVYKDLRVEAQRLKDDAKTYIGDDGSIATTINAIHDVTAEIDKMQAGGTSTMFESISQAQEKLKELNDTLQDNAKGLHDLWKAAWDTYLDGIDQVSDKFDDLMDQFERMDDELEFQGQLIELLYGEKAYELMDTLYKGQERSLGNQVQSVKMQLDMWERLWRESGATMENQSNWTEDQKKYYDEWTAAQSKLNDLVIDYIKLLKDDYLNTIEKVLYELEKGLTGSSLDDMKTDWERISAYSDKYLDDVEQAYEAQKLANKIDAEIAKTNDLKKQQKLQAFRDKEIKYLREKEHLTQYDLDAAEARYQIALKEMALEDARENKTSMKLVRNEQGNWSYQYLADEEDTTTKQQELLDAYNDLYQLASDAYEANLEALMTLQEKYLESAREIYLDETLSEEEKEKKLLELRDWYFEQYALLAEENTLYRNDLATSAAALLLEIYKQDEDAYESMTNAERQLVDDLVDANIEDYMDLENKMKDNYKDIGTASKALMADTRRDWTSSAQQLADTWIDNSDEIRKEVLDAHTEIQKATDDYQTKVDWVADAVERDFGPEGITGAIWDASYATDDLKDRTIDLVDESIPYLESLKQAVDEIEAAWMSVKDAIEAAIRELERYINLEAHYAQQQAQQKAQQAAALAQPVQQVTKDSGNNSGSNGSKNNTKQEQKIWSIRTTNQDSGNSFITGTYYSYESARDAVAELEKKNKRMSGRDGERLAYGVVARSGGSIASVFATGGYTGSWNGGDTDGRLAMLHQKELVLNKEDTSNFLSGIQMLRDMSATNGSINKSIMQAVANMASSLGNIRANRLNGTTTVSETNENNGNIFNIQAEFPNANDANEIRQALLSLPNLASQYVARNGR